MFDLCCTHGPPNSKPCADGCITGLTVSLTATAAFSAALVGDEGLEDSLVGEVGDGGSTGPDDFFTLEARARLGGIFVDY